MRILFALPAVFLLAVPARAEPLPRVTTESAEYCEALMARLVAMPAADSTQPRLLAEEGRRLCATGHVRTGIAKLRRAIRLSAELHAGG